MRTLHLRTHRLRDRTRSILYGLAAVGMIAAVLGAVVAWHVVGQLSRTTDRSLILAGDALVTLEASLDVTEEVLISLDDTLDGVATALDVAADGIGDAITVGASTAEVLGVVGPRLVDIEGAIGGIASAAETADNVLRQLSRLPLAPSYDPELDLGAELRDLGTDLGSVGRSLETTAGELAELTDSSGGLESELRSIAGDVSRLRSSLAGTGALVDAYRATVQGSSALAQEARADLDRDLRLTRTLIVILALVFAVGQAVPALLAAQLLPARPAPQPEVERELVSQA